MHVQGLRLVILVQNFPSVIDMSSNKTVGVQVVCVHCMYVRRDHLKSTKIAQKSDLLSEQALLRVALDMLSCNNVVCLVGGDDLHDQPRHL